MCFIQFDPPISLGWFRFLSRFLCLSVPVDTSHTEGPMFLMQYDALNAYR